MTRLHRPLALAVLFVVSATGAVDAKTGTPRVEAVGRSMRQDLVSKATGPTSKDHECVAHDILCGQTVSANLGTHDCATDDGTFYDVYFFSGQNGQTVTIDQMSAAFDSFLVLFDPDLNPDAFDDDGGSGFNSHIVHTLDETSADWAIAASSYDPGQTGAYTLRLQCSGNNPPPPPPPPPPPTCPTGFFSDPSYPDFCFRVMIGNPGDTRDGVREDDCQPDTVCVSGALAGRSEVFLRILGPRPNGFLWPTLVRFTPSRVVVDFYQRSTMQTNTYTLPAIPPGVDDLSGQQDRTGFLP